MSSTKLTSKAERANKLPVASKLVVTIGAGPGFLGALNGIALLVIVAH
jgi:hypothetical protein